MPGITLPNMGLILPTLGGDPGVWDDELNAIFDLVDDHDHTPGKGVKVPVSGLNINADVPLGGNGLTTIGRLAFSKVAALTTGSVTLFVNTADNELYWRNNGGTNVKLTAGGSINTTLVGGIVGDYSAVGAEVAYDDANKRYTFKYNGSPKPWAKLASADLHVYPTGTGTVYVGLKAGASLAASFDMTLPLALPASQVLVQIDATGVMTFTNTLANNANITLQGTGHILRGDRACVVAINPTPSFNVSGGGATTISGHPGAGVPASSSNSFPINFPDADNSLCLINSVVIAMAVTTANCTFTLQFNTPGIGLSNVAGASVVKTPGGPATLTLTPTTPLDITGGGAGATLWLNVAPAATSVTEVYSAIIHTTVAT